MGEPIGATAIHERALVTAPVGRDSHLLASALAGAAIQALSCADLGELRLELARGAGVAIITDDPTDEVELELLCDALAAQPEWSDLPIVVLSTRMPDGGIADRLRACASVTVLERPTGMSVLVSAVQSALRSRLRQYELRDRLEEERRITAELQRANAVKDEFLGLVSHELRTPLTTIVGLSRVLLRKVQTEDPEIQESLAQLNQDSDRLQQLIENMLILSRLDHERVTMEPVSVEKVISRVVAEHTQKHASRTIRVQAATAPIVEGNPVWIGQILRNLLSNAEKHTPAGGRIDVFAYSADGTARIDVRDEGSGIDPRDVGRVFERFFRSESVPVTVAGAGLGLAVCQRLVELQGGSIWVEPREAGSQFSFTLPALPDVDEAG